MSKGKRYTSQDTLTSAAETPKLSQKLCEKYLKTQGITKSVRGDIFAHCRMDFTIANSEQYDFNQRCKTKKDQIYVKLKQGVKGFAKMTSLLQSKQKPISSNMIGNSYPSLSFFSKLNFFARGVAAVKLVTLIL